MFIKPSEGRVTSSFGVRTAPNTGNRSFHSGTDIAKSGNVPILASASGIVSRVGQLGTYGNVVMILHNINGRTFETNYAHLHSYNVRVGQKVDQGDQIGRMGSTGNSTGQHLHFEIHDGRYASGQPNAVDPELYVNFGSKYPRRGDKGPHVLQLQKDLNQLGFNLEEDRLFGPATERAVKDFQKQNGLAVDGIAGPNTQAKIAENLKTTASLPNKVLRYGDKGEAVKKMQEALVSVYFYPEKNKSHKGVDGSFGPATLDAVKRFQSVYTPYDVDGIFGPKTRAALLEVMNK
ncbi:Putative peptidoglycan binding domain-containing protein [Oceanobacillus limi]|uniref:Putative peptidoglycan binding domain-containing protein n=1 Tax=Oceanobacillus limi TaxID=930131 RepID=A0A1I0E5D5_9BACI|nr:peptidoglycan-binding protein [Oceanobacillus limi]SET40188.1 Putative peptidoglycan binding domain-containing protein [Oceanobacillus limi]